MFLRIVCFLASLLVATPSYAKSQMEFDQDTIANLEWLYRYVDAMDQWEAGGVRWLRWGQVGHASHDDPCSTFTIRIRDTITQHPEHYSYSGICDVSFIIGEQTITVKMSVFGLITNKGKTANLFDIPSIRTDFEGKKLKAIVEPDFQALGKTLEGQIKRLVAEKKKPYCYSMMVVPYQCLQMVYPPE